jgi:hypothetical protein
LAFVNRLINLQFTKGQGTFTGSGTSTLTLSGLRVRFSAQLADTAQMAAQLQVYGMSLSQMNDLSTLGLQFNINAIGKNTVTVSAGDSDNPPAAMYSGQILVAYLDATAAPQVAFTVLSHTLGFISSAPANASSYSGSTDVATACQNIANRADLNFENNGVSAKLNNHYMDGSLGDQLANVCDASDTQYTIDNNTLAIWPRGQARGGIVPLISPATGMWGYPVTNGYFGMIVRTVFNRDIKMGGTVQVESPTIQAANGTWFVRELAHELESLVPGGQWYSTLGLTSVNPVTAPSPSIS